MKIHGPSRPGPLAPRNVEKSTQAQRAGRSEAGERVQVSSQAKALAEAKAPEAPDASRIERLKEAIRSGTFVIDADRIAGAMLREEQ